MSPLWSTALGAGLRADSVSASSLRKGLSWPFTDCRWTQGGSSHSAMKRNAKEMLLLHGIKAGEFASMVVRWRCEQQNCVRTLEGVKRPHDAKESSLLQLCHCENTVLCFEQHTVEKSFLETRGGLYCAPWVPETAVFPNGKLPAVY